VAIISENGGEAASKRKHRKKAKNIENGEERKRSNKRGVVAGEDESGEIMKINGS